MNVFYRWTDAVQFLKELITQTSPLPGYGIAVEQTANGRRISLCGQTSGSATNKYDGAFAITDSSDEETAELTIAEGYYRHGLIHCLVPQSLVNPEESGYVYIKITNDGNRYIFESDCAATLPASESGTLYVPLAYVTVKDGAIEKITQWQYGELLTPGVM